jgi:hypothetical protein
MSALNASMFILYVFLFLMFSFLLVDNSVFVSDDPEE